MGLEDLRAAKENVVATNQRRKKLPRFLFLACAGVVAVVITITLLVKSNTGKNPPVRDLLRVQSTYLLRLG